MLGINPKPSPDQSLAPLSLPNELTHSLMIPCVRSVDTFIHKITHRLPTVIPSGFSTGFDNPHRRAVQLRAIPEFFRRHATQSCGLGRRTRRRFPEDCASSILLRAPSQPGAVARWNDCGVLKADLPRELC